MSIATAKENVLKKIREALSEPTSIPFIKSEGNQTVFTPPHEELDVLFAENFTKLQGRFIFCINTQELAFQLSSLIKKSNWQNVYCQDDKLIENFAAVITNRLPKENLAQADISITGCEYLIARTGSIVLSAAGPSGRTGSVYAPIHICIAYTSQMVYDIKDALQKIQDKYKENIPSLITLATGPSRTADIEKTLIVGVHGPKEVFVFLVENE